MRSARNDRIMVAFFLIRSCAFDRSSELILLRASPQNPFPTASVKGCPCDYAGITAGDLPQKEQFQYTCAASRFDDIRMRPDQASSASTLFSSALKLSLQIFIELETALDACGRSATARHVSSMSVELLATLEPDSDMSLVCT